MDASTHTYAPVCKRVCIFEYSLVNSKQSILLYYHICAENIPAEQLLRVPVVYNISRSD